MKADGLQITDQDLTPQNTQRRANIRQIALLLALTSGRVMAAPCCGSNGLFPALVSGDDRSQVTATTTYARVLGDALTTGPAPRAAGDVESRATVRLDAVTLLSDRWQVGVSLPIVSRARTNGTASAESAGLGDAALTLGWEALPRWSYSSWKPKGILFASLVLPTSRTDADVPFALQSRGRGFFALSVGMLLQKTWSTWDSFAWAEAHHALPRTRTSSVGDYSLVPTPGASAGLGVGWNRGAWRLGLGLSASYDGPTETTGALAHAGLAEWSWPVSAQVSYLFSEAFSLACIYNDNVVLPAQQVALQRSLGLVLQARWDR